MNKLVRESIFKGPTDQSILDDLRKREPTDQLKFCIINKYWKGIIDALERGADILTVMSPRVILDKFSNDEIKKIVERDTGINYHIYRHGIDYVNVYLIPTFHIINNVLDDVSKIFYQEEGTRISSKEFREFLKISMYSIDEFQHDLRTKYENFYIEKKYHLEVGFNFLLTNLLDIDQKKIKDHILKERGTYTPSFKHFLLPENEEEFINVHKDAKEKLLEFHEDVMKIVDNYSDAEYWANKMINFDL